MIPFIDLKAQFARIDEDVSARMRTVLESGAFIMGPEVGELEKRLAAFVGARHAISCSSGTDALLMILMALGVGPGDAVITTPFTFIATAEVIALLGATPVFADIDPDTYNLSPAAVEAAIAALQGKGDYPLPTQAKGGALRLRGILSADMFGLPADCDALNAIAARHGIFHLEDAAQSMGGSYKGRMTCSLAQAAGTSFFPAKPLGCYGDGGMVFTDDDGLADIVQSIRVHGKGSHKYDNARVGINGRLDTLQAAVLLAKLDIFEDEIAARQRVAGAYTQRLAQIPGVTPPHVPEGSLSAWAQYTVRVEDGRREAMQAALKAAGVPTAVYYPKPLHQQTAFAGLGYATGDMPASEMCAGRVFSLPMHPYMGEETIAMVCDAMAGAAGA
ncbi:MAG: DegT/DnrJ/EryC1/StrS family aminotransferase [Desulfovibrionaceae bacterium]